VLIWSAEFDPPHYVSVLPGDGKAMQSINLLMPRETRSKLNSINQQSCRGQMTGLQKARIKGLQESEGINIKQL
jgi:hypothetical protein